MVMAPFTNKHDMGISLIDYGWLMVDEKIWVSSPILPETGFTTEYVMVVNLTKNAISYQT